ncbi:MAG TPA: efflux RND transporter periplasmic adaptor subunit [Candidatus Eisenbacteria bacterium]|nr:efflux RND transporter periplasmic adaptor subunit [Candidatus Eisenbacteria bacterium]
MAEKAAPSRAKRIRGLILLLVIVGGGIAIWKYQHRREGYTGGDVVTTGTVEAVQVSLGFKVPGKIADVPVNEGDRVQPGQVIAQLDAQDLDVAVRSAQAALESARAALGQARANREKAARDLARMRELSREGASTQQQLDAAVAAAAVGRAQVDAAAAQVHQAESALAQAQLTRSYAVVRSPLAGQVTEKIHHPGEMVTVGTAVVTIADLDTLKVHAAVDETRVGAVRPGDSVSVRVYTFDKKVFAGVVTDVSPSGDFATRKDWGAQRRDIRTFDVTARIPNPEGLLKDGMTADVTIHAGTPGAVPEARAEGAR